jgi:glycosyltransferase involved in cell wall biosynthesis
MHILIVADHAWINGGQSKVAIESALGLAGRGHRVTYFAAVGPADPWLARAGVEVVCLDQHDINSAPSKVGFLKQILWNQPAAERLRQLLSRMDPRTSVVHVHAWAKAISPSIGTVLKKSAVPCVYTMHEFFLVCPNGGFYHYPKAQTCKLKPMSMGCLTTNCDSRNFLRKAVRVVRQGIVDHGGLRQAFGRVIMISKLQEQASRPYMREGVIYHRVSNPIDLDDPGPKAQAGKDFVFVGRLSREKGVEHFCEAAKLAGVVPVIAGDGPLMNELKERYPQARFLGWQKPEQVLAILRNARALVFPSVWYEGQPLTVYEALAMGTPVIVSDVCAGREAIADGSNGFWFKSGDPVSLARAITNLKEDASADAMTAQAHSMYWSDPLTLDRHLDAIEEIYEEMLAPLRSNASLRKELVRA